MRYLMRQKLFALGDDFVIKDERGRERFVVDSKVFSLGDSLTFQDTGGRTLLTIRQKLLSWGPTYEIQEGDRVVAVVKKALFTLFSCRFSVDVPGPDDLEATGSIFDHEYRFTHVDSDRVAATVSTSWFSLSDSYGVDIEDGEDELLILAATVVLDLCCHSNDG
jgi:uncharacterized protein YxjI